GGALRRLPPPRPRRPRLCSQLRPAVPTLRKACLLTAWRERRHLRLLQTALPSARIGTDRLAAMRCPTRPAARQRPRPDAEIAFGWEVSSRSLPLAALHSITSSARASSVGGTVRPSAIAVIRLITSSNLVGCSTGRSAGLVPRRILST